MAYVRAYADSCSVTNEAMNPAKYYDINGIKMHYIDRGDGDAIVMLHGNPTWSYFYRELAMRLSRNYRVIVPDHIGMGFSEKPQNVDYNLAFHIQNLEKLIEHLNLRNIILIVHDWGGAIGFGYAVNHIANVEKIVVLNSAAFFDEKIPRRINICRGIFGKFLVRRLNLFSRFATFMATTKKLPKETREEYLRPYNSYKNRIGIHSFVRDIPMEEDHRTRYLLDSIESKLKDITSDILILWGEKDFCFSKHFYYRWIEFFPQAKTRLFENAGHYILEDAPDEVLREIEEFILTPMPKP